MEHPKPQTEQEPLAGVIYFTDIAKRSLTREQRDYWAIEGGKAEAAIADLEEQLAEQHARRIYCLQMQGLLP